MEPAGTPVILSTLSGVYLETASLKAWKPSVRLSMNPSSWRPSWMMTFINPLSRATSVPGRCLSHTEAKRTRPIFRGSATMRLAPFSLTALMISLAITGWFSVVLLPMTRKQLADPRSWMLLVMAPEPKAWTRPATVGAWQRRAQWSTLLVPITARMNFWKR